MKERSNILPYGYPLEVSFKNNSNYDLDDFSGERSRTYGVVTVFETQKYTQKIQYTVTVNYIQKILEKGYWIVELNKSKVFINQYSTDRIIDRLNEEFMLEVIYPIKIRMNKYGSIITIQNFDEIVKRFKKFVNKKKKEYSGIYIERYFKLLGRKMNDEYSLITCLEKDWFITSFFMPLYAPNGFSGDRKNVKSYFPSHVAFENPFPYKGELKRPNSFIRPNILAMHYEAENKAKESTVNIDYELNATSFLINDIRNTSEFKKEGEVIKTVKTTIQHLREKDTYTPKSKNNMSLIQRFNKWFNS